MVRDVLEGMGDAWRGRHDVPMPANWSKLAQARFAGDSQLDWLTLQLSARLGDDSARQRLLETLLASASPEDRRLQALTELVEMRYAPLGPNLAQLLTDRAMRGPATRALSAFDDPNTPARLLAVYGNLNEDERAAVVATLASRAGYAAVAAGRGCQGPELPRETFR